MAFGFKYSYSSEYVADEKWQTSSESCFYGCFLPIIVRNPLPFIAALWARAADIGITAAFVTMAFTVSLLIDELVKRTEEVNKEYTLLAPANTVTRFSMKLDEWRSHCHLICEFIDRVIGFFGPALLLKIALGFASPIFEFTKILQTRGQVRRFYFEFLHSIFRFFIILLPSYLVAQKVLCTSYNV